MDKVRVDRWLWSVRIFKSRTIATETCKKGRVKLNDVTIKPSFLIKVGDRLKVVKEGFNLELEVIKLLNKRVSAPLAVICYKDHTPEEEKNKFASWFIGKGRPEVRERGQGRPTKKDRRELEEYKDAYFDDWLSS